MATATFQVRHTRAPVNHRGGFQPPSYALREMPIHSDLPEDDLGRDIAVLIAEHPSVASQVGSFNVRSMTVDAKVEMLSRIKGLLGIKPLRRRHLGYVGP